MKALPIRWRRLSRFRQASLAQIPLRELAHHIGLKAADEANLICLSVQRTHPVKLSITHNSDLFGGKRDRQNVESKESLVIHC